MQVFPLVVFEFLSGVYVKLRFNDEHVVDFSRVCSLLEHFQGSRVGAPVQKIDEITVVPNPSLEVLLVVP